MSKLHLVVAAGLLLAGAPFHLAVAQEPTRAEDPARARRAKFDAARAALLAEADELVVSGSHVGRGAQPGRFYLLLVDLMAGGEKEDFLALTRHEEVVVRAAGMLALAKRFPDDAVAVVEARRESKDELDYMPMGCTVEVITEGRLAEILLDEDAEPLAMGDGAPVPLRRR